MSEYERLRAALDKKLAADPAIRAVVKRIKNGTATLTDTAEYARVLSHILGREVSANVLGLDDRAGVVTQLLHDCYEDVNGMYAQAQTILDEQAGIHIRPQKPGFPAERVQQFAHSLIDPTVKDSVIKRRAKAGCETITKSYHDDCVKKNAQFRHDAGLKCYIVRIGTKCCEWCSEVAGKYEFGDQPEGIFRRHDNCDCTIIYNGQVLRGKRNADGSRSKTWEEPPNANGSDSEPTTFTQEEAKELERRNLAQIRGLKINSSSIDNSGESDIIEARELESLIVSNNGTEVPKDVKTAIEETVSVIPEHLRSRLEQFVPEIIVEEGRGFSSFTSDNNIILDKETATNSILHELGHAWAKMDNLYEDEEFLAVLADGLEREDWGEVTSYVHPYKQGDYVYILESPKFLTPYQGRVYSDFSDVDPSKPIPLELFQEYISVGFQTFFDEPELLRKKDKKLYGFLEARLNEHS